MKDINQEKPEILDKCHCTYSHTPNTETLKSMEDIEKGIGLVACKDVNDLFKKLSLKK